MRPAGTIALLLCWACSAASLAFAEAVPAKDAIAPVTGDEIDLEILPKPKKESYSGKAVFVDGAAIEAGNDGETPAAGELKALFESFGVLGKPGKAQAKVVLSRADKGKEAGWQPGPEQGYTLSVETSGEGATIRIAALEPPGLYYGAQTLRQLCCRKDGKLYVREAAIEDWPSMRRRGMKLAGPDILAMYAPYKLNFGWKYIGLAASGDSDAGKKEKLLASIRELEKKAGGKRDPADDVLAEDDKAPAAKAEAAKLLEDLRRKLKELEAAGAKDAAGAEKSAREAVRAYRDRHAEIAVSYNPGGTLDLTGEYLAKVKATCRFWFEAGVRKFVLSFDDQSASLSPETQKAFGSYGKAQAHLLSQVRGWLKDMGPACRLYLCHQVYYGDLKGNKQVAELAEAGLPDDLELCWTGTGVTTSRLTLDAVRAYGEPFGRRATLFYQNWPITAPPVRCETGPLTPHDPALGTQVEVHMMCSNHDRASYVAYFSGLDWAWNSEGYDPVRSTKVAAREWARRFGADGGKAAYPPLAELMLWSGSHDSGMVVPDQAKRTADELTKLIDEEEALYKKDIALLKDVLKEPASGLDGKGVIPEMEVAAQRRVAHFRAIVKAHASRRTGKAVRLDGAGVLDGKLDEPAWAKAQVLGEFVLEGKEERAAPNASCRVLYDDKFLYVGLRCEEPKVADVSPYGTATGWKIQHGDFVQLVLDTSGELKGRGFACTSIQGQASLYDFGARWMEGFEVKVSREKDAWVAEFRLPLAKLDEACRPAPGRRWGFNAIRRRVVKGEPSAWSSWNPLPDDKDKFNAAYCGYLVFE